MRNRITRRLLLVLPLSAICLPILLFSLPLAGRVQRTIRGAGAPIASITILDPETFQPTREVIVNEGNTVKPLLLVLDTNGVQRTDFDLSYSSLESAVATVDATGSIRGVKAGFSTLAISSGNVVAAGTITVVSVNAGVLGFEISGIAQDLARRLYLANAVEHTILLAQDVRLTPTLYAGIPMTPGLRNDARLQSLFHNPSFLAFNQAAGVLYVSDSANNVIRTVQPGPSGGVEIFAGTGSPGSKDGAFTESTFNNPQGIALDNRGFLWIADSGNHTIRRLNLAKGTVETIAGKAGSPGSADGTADTARFNSPLGIALENESLGQQLDRERKGLPPPPVLIIVADTGNGVIRRVRETGEVETLVSSSPVIEPTKISRNHTTANSTAAPIRFSSPTGVAVDPSGNIFVTDAAGNQVRTILRNGQVASAVQANTLTKPRGIVIGQGGRVFVADGKRASQQILFGEPKITSVTPGQVSVHGGARVTVKGANISPDSRVIVGPSLISEVEVSDTQTLSFTVPILPGGVTTLTILNRGGIAQASFQVDPVPLNELPAGYITTVAGGSTFSNDASQATAVTLNYPMGIAVNGAGDLHIADTNNHRIRRIDSRTGIISTVAGIGTFVTSGDGGLALSAGIGFPADVCFDSSGNMFIIDSGGNQIRKVAASTGIITTVAGNGDVDFYGDNGPATNAALNAPTSLAVDGAGNLYISDTGNQRIRKVTKSTGIITTAAGNGDTDFYGDSGPATDAALNGPTGLAVDNSGNLYIADTYNQRIRRVAKSSGTITTVVGTGFDGFSGDNGPGVSASLSTPTGIAFDTLGNMHIADSTNHRIRKVDSVSGNITTVAGNGFSDFTGDSGPAKEAALNEPRRIIFDASGNLFIEDFSNDRIRKVDALTGNISTFAGIVYTISDNVPAIASSLNLPATITIDSGNNLLIADTANNRVRKVSSTTGIITTIAGNGRNDESGDGGPATLAAIDQPYSIALDSAGNLYIAATYDHRVQKVTLATGIITTVAGTGRSGFSGDGGLAAFAALNTPQGVVVDSAGNLYISDTGNFRIRKVAAGTGLITTIAGNGVEGSSGDNGPAVFAALDGPAGLALDSSGNVYVADFLAHRIRKISVGTGIITTAAGTGEHAFRGDGGQASSSPLASPYGVGFDAGGNLFIADQDNNRIRKVDSKTGIITTIAGSDAFGSLGDNGLASAAAFAYPTGVAFDRNGNILVVDRFNNRIRAIRGPSGPPACNFSIQPTSRTHLSTASSGSVSITAAAGCGWTAKSNATWITIDSGGSGTGNGTVNYGVAALAGTGSRTGTVTIADKTFTVTQNPVRSQPSFDITLSQSSYSTGATITATEFRIRNPGSSSAQVALRVWLKVPSVGEVNLIDIGSDGSFSLPANLDVNLGPFSLLAVTATFPPHGNWELNSRVTNPVTGIILNEDINPFVVQ